LRLNLCDFGCRRTRRLPRLTANSKPVQSLARTTGGARRSGSMLTTGGSLLTSPPPTTGPAGPACGASLCRRFATVAVGAPNNMVNQSRPPACRSRRHWERHNTLAIAQFTAGDYEARLQEARTAVQGRPELPEGPGCCGRSSRPDR